MIKYVVLLRGINVGGKNKLSMQELKMATEKLGYKGVSTYINSGNMFLFSDKECSFIKNSIEKVLKSTFSLEVPVYVAKQEDITEAVKNAPEWWGIDKDSVHDALFVIPPACTDDILKSIGKIKPEYEKVFCYKQVIFWSAPRETFSKTSFSKLASKPECRNSVTVRNANTTRKLTVL